MTFSISTGIGIGIISLVAIALGSGKSREHLTPFTCGLAAVFVLHFLEPLLFRWMGK